MKFLCTKTYFDNTTTLSKPIKIIIAFELKFIKIEGIELIHSISIIISVNGAAIIVTNHPIKGSIDANVAQNRYTGKNTDSTGRSNRFAIIKSKLSPLKKYIVRGSNVTLTAMEVASNPLSFLGNFIFKKNFSIGL